MKVIISDEEFIKWRCLVALAHADGIVTEPEENVIQLQIMKRQFSAEQLEILRHDLKFAQDFKALYQQVEREEDRQHLVKLAYTLFWSDNDFDQAERKIYDFLKENSS